MTTIVVYLLSGFYIWIYKQCRYYYFSYFIYLYWNLIVTLIHAFNDRIIMSENKIVK